MSRSNFRALAPILVGFGGASAAYGSFYLFKQHLRSRIGQELTIPDQWTLLTKTYVHKGLDATSPKDQLEWFEKAVKSLVGDGNIDLSKKSADWLAGYGDLVRKIGITQSRLGIREAVQPLIASDSIPNGKDYLKYDARVELYRLTNDPKYILSAINVVTPCESLDNLTVPQHLQFGQAPAYLEVGQSLLAQKKYNEALELYLRLHRSLPADQEDTMCLRGSIAGYAGQIFWKLNQKSDATNWLKLSQRESTRSTPACRQCNTVATQLLKKTGAQP